MVLRSRWLRSPLLHFIVLGGAIFAVARRPGDPHHVTVDAVALAAFEHAQAARDGVPALSPARAREVDNRAIEDEVLYREAIRLGLDRDDPVIRQRLIQKLLLLAEDMGGASRAPTDGQLEAFFARDPARFRLAPRVRFVHVFASRRDALPAAASLSSVGIPETGEAFPRPREVRADREDLVRTYGEGFAVATAALPIGEWSDPVASSFGFHRVRVDAREAGRIPAFVEAKSAIAFEYALDVRSSAIGDYLRDTFRGYAVDVGDKPLEGFVPSQRVALRSDPSAED